MDQLDPRVEQALGVLASMAFGGTSSVDPNTPGMGTFGVSSNATSQFGLFGQLAMGGVNKYLNTQYGTPAPGIATLVNVNQIRQAAQYDAFQSSLNSMLKPHMGNGSVLASGMIAQAFKASGGPTAEMLELADRFGVSSDPGFQKFISLSGSDSLMKKRYGNLSIYKSQEQEGLRDKIKGMGESSGRYASVLMAAEDFNLGSRYEGLAGAGQEDRWKKAEQDLTHAKNLLGFNPGQVFELMSSLYEGVIGDQIPKMVQFSEKLFALQSKVPGGLDRVKAMASQFNQQARAAGINDTSFGFDVSSDQLLTGMLGDRYAKEKGIAFNVATASGGAQQDAIARVASTRGRVYNQVFSLMGVSSWKEFQDKVKSGGYGENSFLGRMSAGTASDAEINAAFQGRGLDASLQGLLDSNGYTGKDFADAIARGEITSGAIINDALSDPKMRALEWRDRGVTPAIQRMLVGALDKKGPEERIKALLDISQQKGLLSTDRSYVKELVLRQSYESDPTVAKLRGHLSGSSDKLDLDAALGGASDDVKYAMVASAIAGITDDVDSPATVSRVNELIKKVDGEGFRSYLGKLKSFGLEGDVNNPAEMLGNNKNSSRIMQVSAVSSSLTPEEFAKQSELKEQTNKDLAQLLSSIISDGALTVRPVSEGATKTIIENASPQTSHLSDVGKKYSLYTPTPFTPY